MHWLVQLINLPSPPIESRPIHLGIRPDNEASPLSPWGSDTIASKERSRGSGESGECLFLPALPLTTLFRCSTLPLSALLILSLFQVVEASFELDDTISEVECVECVQLWPAASGFSPAPKCTTSPRICTGNACFMRQCKHCPIYQYMSGCVSLTRWQISDLEFARRGSDLRVRRVGASLLCEDSFNQTTCICNRRDKCNTIHSHLPYSVYAEGLFTGIVNFDNIISQIDPRYAEVIGGFSLQYRHQSSALHLSLNPFLNIVLLVLLINICA